MKIKKAGRRAALGAAALAATATAVALVAAAPAHADANGKVIGADSSRAVGGEYIVKFKSDTKATKTAKSFAADNGAKVKDTYKSINAFSVRASKAEAEEMASDPNVAYVEANLKYTIAGTQDDPKSWGLDRVDQKDANLDKKYNYPDSAGEGVTVYGIDTGVDKANTTFGGRVEDGYNAIDPNSPPMDDHGHGTHTMGTAISDDYGVAKKAKGVAVKVLDAQGSGTTEQVVAGIDWVTENHKGDSVANMSLGGGTDQALDDAVAKSIASGVTYAIAAGNESSDACSTSPAEVPEAITVAATDNTDTQADFSNFGKCVDLYAPGVDIVSTVPSNGEETMSGTSMATPHVAGIAALYLGENPGAAPADVSKALVDNGLKDVVQNPGADTPNVEANTGFMLQ
ncbi:MAG TPA: S8 family peptidase [Stackebrandtia sp.]|uniref:S8 family peptidase n=1 Tax=Stackebrandtia sp. TaxID=2023065 RepID=UPI002D3D9BB4|nr:S8 family peptidase [Stackebrandtia sp.]HZE42069.1 S8 family peptidase [Stackebrandtia sp.]